MVASSKVVHVKMDAEAIRQLKDISKSIQENSRRNGEAMRVLGEKMAELARSLNDISISLREQADKVEEVPNED